MKRDGRVKEEKWGTCLFEVLPPLRGIGMYWRGVRVCVHSCVALLQ